MRQDSKKKRTRRPVWRTILCICCFIIAASASFALYVRITNVEMLQTETRTELHSDLLETSIRQIAELSTLTQVYSEVGFFESQSTLSIFGREVNLPGTGRSFIIRFQGELRFGILVEDIRIHITEGAGHHVRVYLPEPVILSHFIDIGSIQLLDERSGLFARLELEDYTHFIAQQQLAIEAREFTQARMLEARESTEHAISTLLQTLLSDAAYTIEFVYPDLTN